MNAFAARIPSVVPGLSWSDGSNPYTATINGKQLRFYDPPHGEVDYPWVNFGDAIALMDVPDFFRKQ